MTVPRAPRTPDTSARFFDRLYRKAADPWNFRHSRYERERYEAIVDSLGDRRYRYGFEPGCAIGELTVLLAPLCDQLEAFDFSETAVRRAQHRCRRFRQVRVYQGGLPQQQPGDHCDLIVFSEIGYYFTQAELTSLVEELWQALRPGGRFLACHWLGYSDDHRLHGSEVADILAKVFGPSALPHRPDRNYCLQRWSKR